MFQKSGGRARSGDKEQNQDQKAVVRVDDIEKNARQAENAVKKYTRLIYSIKLYVY